MKKLLLIFLAMMAMVAAGAPPRVPQESVLEIIKRFQTVLPKGWGVSYDTAYAILKVKRDEPALAVQAIPGAGPEGNPAERREIEFSFRVAPKISSEDFERLAAENAKTRLKMNAAYGVLVSHRIQGKGDSFSPQTDEDKKLVAFYRELKDSLHPLPDFYFGEVSLAWFTNGPHTFSPPPVRAMEESVREEFEKARASVVGLLKPYTSDPEQSGLPNQ